MKCKFENCIEAEFENRYILRAPSKCGNDVKACKCSTFSQVPMVSREHCKDYQEIKIQVGLNNSHSDEWFTKIQNMTSTLFILE